MEIANKIVKSNNDFVAMFATGRFPRPKEPRKMKRAFFAEEIKTAVASGQCAMAEQLLNNYSDGKYETLDDIIADLHVLSTAVLNDFRMTASNEKCMPYRVEDFLPGGKLMTGKKL